MNSVASSPSITESASTESSWSDSVDIFDGAGGQGISRESTLPRISASSLRIIEQANLERNKHGMDTSTAMADMVFSMLKRNEFQTVPVDYSKIDGLAPCVGEKEDEFYAWEEYADRIEHDNQCMWAIDQVEPKETPEWFDEKYPDFDPQVYIAGGYDPKVVSTDPDPEREYWGWSRYDYTNQCRNENLDLNDDDMYQAALTRLNVLNAWADSLRSCMACPLKASCVSASVTLLGPGGGLDFDAWGIRGGYDGESRKRIWEKVVAKKRAYDNSLKRDGIYPAKNGSHGMDENSWERFVNSPEDSLEEVEFPEDVDMSDEDIDISAAS